MIRRAAVLVVAVAACSKRAAVEAEDCKVVREDAVHAMAKLSQKYPHDAVKVAATIEGCVAPTGDECERLDKVVKAIPALAPSLPKAPEQALELCRGMPEKMRRCLLPSYGLAHRDECVAMYEKMAATPITQLEIKPKGRDTTISDEDSPCDLRLALESRAQTITSESRGVMKRHDGAIDQAWLEEQLRALKHPDCTQLEVAAAPGIAYQDTIAAMDVAIKVGLMDIGLADGSDSAAGGAASADEPAQSPPVADATDRLRKAPVVVITRDDIEIGGTRVLGVADVANGADVTAALLKGLPPPPKDGLVILQADQATDMVVMNRVVGSLKSLGYPNVMFAVKNR